MSFGTDPRRLVRTNSPDTSHAAAESVDTSRLEQMVYEAILNFGQRGCISDEVRKVFSGYPYSSITARYRALIDKGYIEDTGERRQGLSGKNQRVMRAIKRDN
jgi:hypothetical protein